MARQPHPYSETRREFLRGVAGGGALAGAAVTGIAGAAPPVRPPGKESSAAPPSQQGYRETAHIRRYYELARR